jgi:hypothetical protein
MKYAFEMGSSGMTYILSFVKIGSGIQKLIGGYRDKQHGDCMNPLLFFRIRKVRRKLYYGLNSLRIWYMAVFCGGVRI